MALNDYAERLARKALCRLRPGVYAFEDVMEDDGAGCRNLPVMLEVTVARGGLIAFDFSGTAAQAPGNINCPESVIVAVVWYVLRCLMLDRTLACAGCFRPVSLSIPAGSLLNAHRPAAVAAGNVETSSRVVDVVLGALSTALPEGIPAASQGTMNNIAFGADSPQCWGYYETIGGGMGIHKGGDGLVREFEFTQAAQCTFLTERRSQPAWGLAGGAGGALWHQ